jgi:hypothetical protein
MDVVLLIDASWSSSINGTTLFFKKKMYLLVNFSQLVLDMLSLPIASKGKTLFIIGE